ncbi:hypothetical protein FHY13_002622 [Xanthomonas arboricola]|nr:hypothetical protein [Xanthomonas euroxanthea]
MGPPCKALAATRANRYHRLAQAAHGSEDAEPAQPRQLLRRRNNHTDTPSITIGGSA